MPRYPINCPFFPTRARRTRRELPTLLDGIGPRLSSGPPYPGLGKVLSPGHLLPPADRAVAVRQSVLGTAVYGGVPRAGQYSGGDYPGPVPHPGYTTTSLLHHRASTTSCTTVPVPPPAPPCQYHLCTPRDTSVYLRDTSWKPPCTSGYLLGTSS